MRNIIILLTIGTLWSCGTKTKDQPEVKTTEENFQLLLKNLKPLETGFTYDLVKQDAENSYTPDKNGDSLFYNPAFAILGALKSDGEIFSIIHFEPGDDMYPVLRTSDKNGKSLDRQILVYGSCAGWDCEYDECDEKLKVINATTIEDILTLVTTPCDSLGNKPKELAKKEVSQRVFSIDNKGKITVTEKIS